MTQQVLNVAPQITGDTGDVSLSPDEDFIFAVTFTDPGVRDRHVVAFDFGDGTGPVTSELAEGQRDASLTHRYAVAGSFAIGVTVTDDGGGSVSVVRTATVESPPVEPPPNEPPPVEAPTAYGVTVETVAGRPVDVVLRATDPEVCELAFRVENDPSHGSLGALVADSCTPGSPNSDSVTVTYTPASGFGGTDSFSFVADDGALVSEPATVSVVVRPVEPEPPPAAITYEAGCVASTPGATELVVPRPPSAAGDVLLASVTVRGKATITAPPGWVLVRSNGVANALTTSAFVRVVGAAGEPSVYRWAWSARRDRSGPCVSGGGRGQSGATSGRWPVDWSSFAHDRGADGDHHG